MVKLMFEAWLVHLKNFHGRCSMFTLYLGQGSRKKNKNQDLERLIVSRFKLEILKEFVTYLYSILLILDLDYFKFAFGLYLRY